MIDTHSHIYMDEFSDGGACALQRALAAGVRHMVLPNVDVSTVEKMKSLHQRFPAATSMALGLHPTEVDSGWAPVVDDMEKELDSGKYVAIGEVGIDLYWDSTKRKEQMEAFARQLRIADRRRLPAIIHCREALDDVLAVVREVAPTVNLVFHSFTGSPGDVRKIREVCDPYFGINGVVTFKSASPLRESLAEIGLGRMLLETDSPYLAPVPHRGGRNESAYIPDICAKIADTLGCSFGEVSEQTDRNAVRAFKISPSEDNLEGAT